MKRAIMWIWTFPCPLMAWVNRRGGKLLPLVGLIGKEEPLPLPGARQLVTFAYVYKWWGGSRRFSFAAWPNIYVPSVEKIDIDRLMLHELRHLQQQVRWGWAFLPAYVACFVALLPFKKFKWYFAYKAIPFEVDARRWTARKLKEMRE